MFDNAFLAPYTCTRATADALWENRSDIEGADDIPKGNSKYTFAQKRHKGLRIPKLFYQNTARFLNGICAQPTTKPKTRSRTPKVVAMTIFGQSAFGTPRPFGANRSFPSRMVTNNLNPCDRASVCPHFGPIALCLPKGGLFSLDVSFNSTQHLLPMRSIFPTTPPTKNGGCTPRCQLHEPYHFGGGYHPCC